MTKLVQGAKNLHKSYSVILAVLLVIVSVIEKHQGLLAEMLHSIPFISQYVSFPTLTTILGVAIIIGRYLRQPSLENVDDMLVDLVALKAKNKAAKATDKVEEVVDGAAKLSQKANELINKNKLK